MADNSDYRSSTVIDPAEAIAAIAGIGLLTGERHADISVDEIRRAQNLADTIEAKAKSTFNQSLDPRPPPAINWRRSLTRLAKLQKLEDHEARASKFPPGYERLAIAYNIFLHQLQPAILQMLPVQALESIGGTETAPPSDLKVWKFLSILQVIDEPLSVFRLISNGQLLKKQALAVKTIYPTLAEAITTALASCWIDRKSTKKDYRPNWILYTGLSAWFEGSPMPQQLMARAQAAHIRLRQQKQQQDANNAGTGPNQASQVSASPSIHAQYGQI